MLKVAEPFHFCLFICKALRNNSSAFRNVNVNYMVQGKEELDPESSSGQFHSDLKDCRRRGTGGWAANILRLAMCILCGVGIFHVGVTNE